MKDLIRPLGKSFRASGWTVQRAAPEPGGGTVAIKDFNPGGTNVSTESMSISAFDGIACHVVRGGSAMFVEQPLRITKPAPGKLLPLNSVHRDIPHRPQEVLARMTPTFYRLTP